MKLAVLFTLAALVAITGNAAAIGPNPIVDLVYQNVQSVSACLATSVSGSISVTISSEPPFIIVDSPILTPPSPDCLVLPV